MPCRRFEINSPSHTAPFSAFLNERVEADGRQAGVEAEVAAILADVRARGLAAVLERTRVYDSPDFAPERFAVPLAELETAKNAIPQADCAILLEAAANIRVFHEAQKENSWFSARPDGTVLGQRILPLERVGLYVPGGRGGETPLISSLLMNVIPALVAGVPEIVVISPPQRDGSINPYILAAAALLGVREVYAAGSAWAIAALAFGAGPLKPVHLICGPGNLWVTTAKRQLVGKVGIDMVAGPSEVMIIADADAPPNFIAADMLAQAEHDPMAAAVCVSPSPALLEAVRAELLGQTADLPRAETARRSLNDWGALVLTPDLETAAVLANLMAPEHLELMVKDPAALAGRVRHAGVVFLGAHSAEALGDYFAGPNHVLPTLGAARFSSGLGVHNFYRRGNLVAASPAFARDAAASVGRLARLEGLEGHARAAELRGKRQKSGAAPDPDLARQE